MVNSNSLHVIVRFHDLARLRELDRALFALVHQFYRPTTIHIVTQRFSDHQLSELERHVAHHRSLPDPVSILICNFESSDPPDARSALLNLGLRTSGKGRFFAFLDYDDVIYPEAYQMLIAQLESSDSAIAFGGIVCKHCQVSDTAIVVTQRERRYRGTGLLDLFRDNFCPIHSFVIDRLKMSDADLFFNERLCRAEDYDFLLRICAKYKSDFSLVSTVIGDYYFKDDGSNTTMLTVPTEDAAASWRYAVEFTDLQKRFIRLSSAVRESVQLQQGQGCQTIADLLSTVGHGQAASAQDALLRTNGFNTVPEFVPPGHFYSPIPSKDDVFAALQFAESDISINPLGASISSQAKLLERLAPFIREFNPPNLPSDSSLYYYPNDQFGLPDASLLHSQIRLHKPKRIIEVGSGYSSAVMLDTVRDFQLSISLTFIEPYPERLKRLVSKSRLEDCTVIESKVQEVSLEVFSSLEAGDFLFIDCSHVLKPGSDLAFLLSTVLPRLSPGVIVHIHDIFYNWEYPSSWLNEGRSWNELYVVRAILQFSDRFEVLIHWGYLSSQLKDVSVAADPLSCGSLWLRFRG